MSALDHVQRFYDGPIPPSVRSAAIAADFHASLESPRSPVRLRVKSYTAAGIVDRMADEMRRVSARGRPCYRADLAQAGFSASEMDRHGENARALAARRVEASGEQKPVEFPVIHLLTAMQQLRSVGLLPPAPPRPHQVAR